MEYDAVAISSLDVAAGVRFIQQTKEKGFPWISANLVDADGKALTSSYVTKRIGTLTVGIIGLTDDIGVNKSFRLLPYQKSLQSTINDINKNCDILILLSNLPGATNKTIAKKFPEIDIIMSSDRTLGNMVPMIVGNTLITQTSSRGKYLGKLDVTWNKGTEWQNDRVILLGELLKREKDISSRLDKMLASDAPASSISKGKVARLQLQQEKLKKEIEKRRLAEPNGTATIYNTKSIRFLPVQPTTAPEDIESIVRTIDADLKKQSKK
jgi:5'-nucleotidase/UDP-sugar diphosphatase